MIQLTERERGLRTYKRQEIDRVIFELVQYYAEEIKKIRI